ncbi:hypothetical protein JKF63_05103 [Porcisia hertigi]|uniref:Uncharacterized protein n=1 Tax=Porcisia hertigi TaxID=2761500 RepID=A0A836HTZ2_9TRYP|nr:hypothetical protein JKF63_05103 [Porcisia hertigi]
MVSLPTPCTPTQTGSGPPDKGVEGHHRRGHHLSDNGAPSGSGFESGAGAHGLHSHEPMPSMPTISNRLPPVIQPNKLSTSATTSSNVSMGQPPSQPQPPTSTATMPTVPTSPAREVSQPDVTLLTVSSPARRCYLLADTSDRSLDITTASTNQIPAPPAPVSAPRPSSTLSGTSLNNNGTRGSLHHREIESRAVCGGGGTTTNAYLHDNPRVVTLVNNLYHSVMTAQPENPLHYLAQFRAGTVPQLPSAQLAPLDTQREDARLTPGRQTHTTLQPHQRLGSGHGDTHPPSTHTTTGGSTSKSSLSETGRQDSSGTRDGDRGETQVGTAPLPTAPPQPTRGVVSSGMPNRPSAAVCRLCTPPAPPQSASAAVSNSASVGGPVLPQSTAGIVTHTNTTSNNVFSSSSASSKHGSSHLLQRTGLVTNSPASSVSLAGGPAGSVGSQQVSNTALSQTGGSGGNALPSSGGAAPHSGNSFLGSLPGIERGEATSSDLASLFSTNSVDLHEFMAEFRLAKEERYGGGVDHPAITLDELACIIESCSFPCADAEVLLGLFDELQPCALYLAGARSPNGTPPAASTTFKCNSLPSLSRGGLANGSVSPPSSLNCTAVATTSADGAAAVGKPRAGRGAITNSPGAAMMPNCNVSGSTWTARGVQGAESCVTAAHPNANIATQNTDHANKRTADEAQCNGFFPGNERADAKNSKLLVINNRIDDAGGPQESSGEDGSHDPCSRCPTDVCKCTSPIHQHLGGLQHPRWNGANNEDTPMVFFDTLLARMAYKIQGWYPSEAIRIAFYGMVVDEESGAATVAVEGNGRGAGLSGDGPSAAANARSLRRAISTESIATSEVTMMGSGSAATATIGGGALSSCTVPLSRCITEGLFARLGMVDLTAGEVHSGLRSAGLPTSQDEQRVFECHLVHFARLVRAITAVSERGGGASASSSHATSLREIFVQRGSNNCLTLGGHYGNSGTVPTTSAL